MSILSVVPRPVAIAFDLDGTLIDSRVTIARACNVALAAIGRPALPESTIATFVGDGARILLARALGEAPEDGKTADPALLDRMYDAWLAAYIAEPVDGTTWMPGALDLLSLCASAHLPIAVVTNKPRVVADAIFTAYGETARFAVVLGGGDGPLKPSPAPILRAASLLGIAAADMGRLWMVGDGVQDVRAARAAGAFAIAVRGGFASDDEVASAGPNVTVDSLADVARLLSPA